MHALAGNEGWWGRTVWGPKATSPSFSLEGSGLLTAQNTGLDVARFFVSTTWVVHPSAFPTQGHRGPASLVIVRQDSATGDLRRRFLDLLTAVVVPNDVANVRCSQLETRARVYQCRGCRILAIVAAVARPRHVARGRGGAAGMNLRLSIPPSVGVRVAVERRATAAEALVSGSTSAAVGELARADAVAAGQTLGALRGRRTGLPRAEKRRRGSLVRGSRGGRASRFR